MKITKENRSSAFIAYVSNAGTPVRSAAFAAAAIGVNYAKDAADDTFDAASEAVIDNPKLKDEIIDYAIELLKEGE